MIHGDIEDQDIEKLAKYIKEMAGIGVLIPDDELEDYVREVGHLPERTKDNSKRELPKVTNSIDDDIDENVNSAKKRLGRL